MIGRRETGAGGMEGALTEAVSRSVGCNGNGIDQWPTLSPGGGGGGGGGGIATVEATAFVRYGERCGNILNAR